MAQMVENLLAMQEIPELENPLEKGMWQHTPAFLENSMDRRAWQATQSMRSQRVEHNWATKVSFKGNPSKK